MICPLPRANGVFAFRGGAGKAMGRRGATHALCRGRCGADYESQGVICRVLAGTLTWPQGSDILGIHTRSLRRWRARYEREGVLGLYVRRPSLLRRRAQTRGLLVSGISRWKVSP